MLDYREVRVAFDGRTALDGLSLRFATGSTTALLGPSGCGKSTLLRLAVGLVHPDRGSVHVDGRPVRREDLLALRRRIGYVIQQGGLFPHLDLHDNVTLLARHLGWPAARIAARFEELLELVRLDPALRTRRPGELSGGERQRGALMRALMLDPPLLLLDEPLAALDPLVRSGLQRELRELFGRLDKTVLTVTHDIAEAVLLGERVVLMHAGRIEQVGTARELLESPASAFARDFVAAQRGAREVLTEVGG
jgi:osmoprotectant transport system ATP-binding protein